MIDLSAFTTMERPEDNADGDFKPLPKGDYDVEIENITERKTGAGDNMLAIMFNVTGPTHVGRKLFTNLNLWHSTSEQAREISLRELWFIHDAVGLDKLLPDATLLVGRSLKVSIEIEPHYTQEDLPLEEVDKWNNPIKKYIKSSKTSQAPKGDSTGAKKPWEA